MTGAAVTLSLAAIDVGDLARSVRFYTEGCGFELEREIKTPSLTAAIVRAGTAGLELIAAGNAAGSAAGVPGDGLRKFVLATADPAVVMERARALGGTVIAPAARHPAYGTVIGLIADPDGYRLEFIGRPAAGGRDADH